MLASLKATHATTHPMKTNFKAKRATKSRPKGDTPRKLLQKATHATNSNSKATHTFKTNLKATRTESRNNLADLKTIHAKKTNSEAKPIA